MIAAWYDVRAHATPASANGSQATLPHPPSQTALKERGWKLGAILLLLQQRVQQQGDCRQLPMAWLCGSGQDDDYKLSSWSLYSPVRALPCLSCRAQAQAGMEPLCPGLGHLQSHATCPRPAGSSLWHRAEVLREI